MTNNDVQDITQTSKGWATRTHYKPKVNSAATKGIAVPVPNVDQNIPGVALFSTTPFEKDTNDDNITTNIFWFWYFVFVLTIYSTCFRGFVTKRTIDWRRIQIFVFMFQYVDSICR